MTRLNGRRLLVTRSAEDAAAWAETLAGEGAEPVVFPCIRCEAIADPALASGLTRAIAAADWLVFTSRRGVETLVEIHGGELPADLRLAAVGEATAAALRERFGRVDFIGSGTAAALGQELAAVPAVRNGARCVLILAANAGESLEIVLRKAGAGVERFEVYRTVPAGPTAPKQSLSALGCDTVLFASPTAVTGFDNQVNVDLGAQIVTIGPSTSAAVRERRWRVAAEAKEPNLSGIIDCLLENNCA
jgi:uroporphyrinogen-III synthase